MAPTEPESQTRNFELTANPALAGTIGSSVLFALLTLLRLDQVHRHQTDVLTDTIVSPVTLNISIILAVMAAAVPAFAATTAIHMVRPIICMKELFNPWLYVNVWLCLVLPANLLSILAAAAFY